MGRTSFHATFKGFYMDKIATGIVDKLNIIGFFNVILSGGVLLYGISSLLDLYTPNIFFAKLGLENDIEKGIIICVACYIIGNALQCLQEYLFKALKRSVMNGCLADVEKTEGPAPGITVLTNSYRRKGIIKLASDLFKQKGLGEFDPNDPDMCNYFFDYCDYSNSIKGNGSKASRLSESATFYEQLAVAFYMLVLVGVLILIFAHTGEWPYCIGYLVLGAIFTARAYKYRKDWGKTVLATYEATVDKELSENKERILRLRYDKMPE